MAAYSNSSEPRKLDRRRPSCDTLCSSNSSCALQKRKPLHPLAASVRTKTTTNPIAQRVLSAKFLRFKTLQNQLNDANYHISQLSSENKLLKNLQKRQDLALAKYEGANAHLPQVLESHHEETRILEAKNKSLRKILKDLTDQIKTKDEELGALQSQNKYLLSLNKHKNLEERGKLNEKIEDLTAQLKESESKLNVLNRKLVLETKNFKFKLNAEVSKHKQTQRDLQSAITKIHELMDTMEENGKQSSARNRPGMPEKNRIRNGSIEKSQRNGSTEKKSQRSGSTEMKPQRNDVLPEKKIQSEVNLCNDKSTPVKKRPGILKNSKPITNGSITNLSEDTTSCESPEISKSQLSTQEPSLSEKLSYSSKSPSEHENDSESQIKDFVNNWNNSNNTTKVEEEDTLVEDLNSYSNQVIHSAKTLNDTVDKQIEDFKTHQEDSKIILDTIKNTDQKQQKLKDLQQSGENLSFYDYKVMTSRNSNAELISQMLSEEKNGYSFEEELLSEAVTTTVNLNDPEVDLDDRKKLLAQLKAIDNDDDILISEVKKSRCDVMKELFG